MIPPRAQVQALGCLSYEKPVFTLDTKTSFVIILTSFNIVRFLVGEKKYLAHGKCHTQGGDTH